MLGKQIKEEVLKMQDELRERINVNDKECVNLDYKFQFNNQGKIEDQFIIEVLIEDEEEDLIDELKFETDSLSLHLSDNDIYLEKICNIINKTIKNKEKFDDYYHSEEGFYYLELL